MEDAAERTLAASERGGAEILSLLEPLLLDVQRSLDYYEGEYGRPPATRLTLLPGPIDLPTGCRFHPRCPIVERSVCIEDEPELAAGPSRPAHLAACYFAWTAGPRAPVPVVTVDTREVS